MSLPSPLYSLARRSLPSALAAACCKQQRRSTSRGVGHGSSFAAIASQSYGPKLTMPAPPAARPRKNSLLKTWRMPDRCGRQKSEVAKRRGCPVTYFGCSLEWRAPYSSRNVFAGSMLAIRRRWHHCRNPASPTRAPARRRELSAHHARQLHKPRCASLAALPRKAPVPEQDPALITHA